MRLLILLGCLYGSAVWAQTEATAPPLTVAEEDPPAPPPAAAPAVEATAEEEAPRDRSFVRNAGVSAGIFAGGALLGGIAGGVGGLIGGAIFGASLGPWAPFGILLFAPLFGIGGLIGGALVGGGLGWLGSLFFIPPPAPDGVELPANVITVAPADLLARRFSLEYERRLSPHFTLTVAPMFELGSTPSYLWHAGTGPSLTVGLRGYVWGQAPRGAFIGVQAHAGVGTFSHAGSEVETQDTFGGAGVTFGHSWLIANHFALSFGLGAVYQVSAATIPGSGARQVFHEIAPIVRLNLGAAF